MPPAELRLSPAQQDALRRITAEAMRASGEVLSDLILREVQVGEPQLSAATWEELVQTASEPMLVVRVEYVEGVSGSNLLVMRPADAARVAALMMGEEGDGGDGLDEMRMSAVSEAMNQMMGAAATALSQLFGRTIVISPPTTMLRTIADNGALLADGAGDDLVQVAFPIRVAEVGSSPIESRVVQLFPGEFARRLSDEFLASAARAAQAATPRPSAAPAPSAASEAVGWEPGPLASDAETMEASDQDRIPFDVIKRITVPVTVRLGEAHLSLQEVLSLTRGSIVQLDAADGQPVDVLVSGTLVARGEVVVVRERFGVRITQLVRPELLSGAAGG